MRNYVYWIMLFTILAGTCAGVNVPGQFHIIDDAIQAAQQGETVNIEPGTYDASTQNFPIRLRDGVSVKGSGKYLTVIDASGTGAPAFIGENVNTTDTLISDLTIQGGNLPASGGAGMIIRDCQAVFLYKLRFKNNSGTDGGAVLIDNATAFIRECEFTGNLGNSGGAIHVTDPASAPIIVYSEFRNNSAGQSGGAVYINGASGFEVNNSIFESNLASVNGGAIVVDNCNPNILSNTFRSNEAQNGGAVAIISGGGAVQGNTFLKNSSDSGGAVYSTGGTASIYGNIMGYNSAGINGGAYYADASSDQFLNNVIYQNISPVPGGAAAFMDNSAGVAIVNNTISYNQSNGISLSASDSPIFNNIISHNNATGVAETDAISDPDCQYNIFYDNTSGNYLDEGVTVLNNQIQINSALNAPQTSQMNIVDDPLFEDAWSGNFHIKADSPAKDAATATPPVFPFIDMDHEQRNYAYAGSGPDIGADELAHPHLVEPVLYYDVDENDAVTSGDILLLNFSRPVDSPTTLTATDFSPAVPGDHLGSGAFMEISEEDPRKLFITVGNSPYLVIEGEYDDAERDPGDPSGIDVASPRIDGLQGTDGLPVSPLGVPGPPGTGLDISIPIVENDGFVYPNSSATIPGKPGSHYSKTKLSIPILSSYYSGLVILKSPLQYFNSMGAVAMDGTFPQFIFDPFNPAILTVEYDEGDIDPSSGEREENMRLFRLNTRSGFTPFFELVPDARGHSQVVDTENNTVSVDIVYLFPPRHSDYQSPVIIPLEEELKDFSHAIYACFPIPTFSSHQKRVRIGTPADSVALYSATGDIYDSHQAVIRGFVEDESGSYTLTLRSPREAERSLYPDDSNSLFVIQATETDGITPVDVNTTATVALGYKKWSDDVFDDDVIDIKGIPSSVNQLTISSVDWNNWSTFSFGGNVTHDRINQVLLADIPASHFYKGRAVIGADIRDDAPFSWDFLFSEQGWDFYSLFDDFDAAVEGNGPGFLSIGCRTNNTFSFWENNTDQLPVNDGYVYRLRVPVETNTFTQVNCPSFRIRANSQNEQIAATTRIISTLEGLASPTSLIPKTYDMLFTPPPSAIDAEEDLDDLKVSFDVINLDDQDVADTTFYFNGVEVQKIPEEDFNVKSTILDYNFTGGNEGWEYVNAFPYYTPAVNQSTGQSLYLGIVDNNTYGSWEVRTEEHISTDTLYRAKFYVYSDAYSLEDTPDMRFRFTTSNYMHISVLRESNSAGAHMAPLRIPRMYEVYYYPEQQLLEQQSREELYLAFDLINLSNKADSGVGIYLDRVTVEELDMPPWPY